MAVLPGAARATGVFCNTAQPHTVDPHGTGNVLEVLLASVLEGDLKLTFGIFLNSAGDTYPTGLRKTFQTRRHVHAIAEEVAMVEHDIPDIDADAELDPLFLGHFGIPLSHIALDIDCAPHRVHNAAELS
jgi:hypothetical protein